MDNQMNMDFCILKIKMDKYQTYLFDLKIIIIKGKLSSNDVFIDTLIKIGQKYKPRNNTSTINKKDLINLTNNLIDDLILIKFELQLAVNRQFGYNAVNKLIKFKRDCYRIIRSKLKAVETHHSDILKSDSDSDSGSEEYKHWSD